MADGRRTSNKRPPLSLDSWRNVASSKRTSERAEAEAARLIQANRDARKARDALIAAGHDKAQLDQDCAFALYFYWRIFWRIKTEQNAVQPARHVEQTGWLLMEWVNTLAQDMPSLFEMPERESPHLSAEVLLDALWRVVGLATLRQDVSRNPDLFGVSRETGATPRQRREAARRFAIGHRAHFMIVNDPHHHKHNIYVNDIAQALFPGAHLSDRMIDDNRDRAGRFFEAMNELDLGPYPGVLDDV